jgi:hypothetical protein
MVERAFEAELEHLFAEAPALPDRDLFVARVSSALDRDWGFRRLVIGGLGLAGGLVGGAQVLRVAVSDRVLAVRDPVQALAVGLSRLHIANSLSRMLPFGASMDAEVLWMSAGLAVLAIGLLVSRSVRDV